VRTILVPAAREDGVERWREVRSAVADQELNVLEPFAKAEGEVAGLLHGPLARRAGGDPADVHPAGAVFDEYQDIDALQQHGVHVQEVDREDPGCLGVQELPPGRARTARRRIDARGVQDLPHCGRRDRNAELGELTVDAAVSPQRILPRQANGKVSDAPDCGGPTGLASLARVVLARGQLAVSGQQRRGRDRKDLTPAPARYEPCQRSEPGPVSGLVPRPADVAAQHRVLVAQNQQLRVFGQITTEQHDQ